MLANAYPMAYAWILTRDKYVEDSPEFNSMKEFAYSVISSKVPNFDFSIMLTTP